MEGDAGRDCEAAPDEQETAQREDCEAGIRPEHVETTVNDVESATEFSGHIRTSVPLDNSYFAD
ncbi:hypothetical protein GCM10009039_24020 [Halocalculus aciditolerans]|uniref:Uncharacterized protein n=1 Tax=Halocalculus aciditolerans TaxID=1383812 RepID=A0A830F8L2_9EURY|nr:hypothetical protein GCM10009039_24020 [Halocalculus aciditolerans]